MDTSAHQKDPRPPAQTQLSTSLPGITTYVTTHDPSGKSTLHSSRPGAWTQLDDKQVAYSDVFTAPCNADLSGEADLRENDAMVAGGEVELVREGGTVCRYYDLSPGYEVKMHRTVSWDVGVVLEGTVEMVLEDGSVSLMRRGDTALQRGTMHAWKNPSTDSWTRMLFILNSTQPLKVGEKELKAHFPA